MSVEAVLEYLITHPAWANVGLGLALLAAFVKHDKADDLRFQQINWRLKIIMREIRYINGMAVEREKEEEEE